MELLIRATRDDHLMVGKLCAPASAGLWAAQRLPLTGLVADGPVAVARPALAATAAAAGIPYLIDPLTPLLLDQQDSDQSWARLPFATAARVDPAQLTDTAAQDELVAGVLAFQREQGATTLIPPYLYSTLLGDQAFSINLALLSRTEHYLRAQRIDLPVVPVFAASLTEYGPRKAWATGLDRYLDAARQLTHLSYVGLSWSTSSPGHESYQKLAHLLAATTHATSMCPVIAWRQGLYGVALTACGALGYETGAGQLERCHYPTYLAARRPDPRALDDTRTAGGGSSVYFGALGRSVTKRVGEALLADSALSGNLVCLDPDTCCGEGPTSMITDWREHAIRSRARELETLDAIPASNGWRLNDVAGNARRAHTTARDANCVLSATDLRDRLPDAVFADLARVADEIREAGQARAA